MSLKTHHVTHPAKIWDFSEVFLVDFSLLITDSLSSRHSDVAGYLFAREETQHTVKVHDKESVNLFSESLVRIKTKTQHTNNNEKCKRSQ